LANGARRVLKDYLLQRCLLGFQAGFKERRGTDYKLV